MAHTQRQRFNSVKEHLESEVHRYDFFQAVDLLHTLSPEVPTLGTTDSPKYEGVRFVPTASFGFSPSAMQKISIPDKGIKAQTKLSTSFLSLYGRDGSLPWHYTTQLRQEEREYKKEAMRGFLDILNHRLLSHFYRAGMKYRLPQNFRAQNDNSAAHKFASFAGLGTRDLQTPASLTSKRLYRYGSLFQQPRSASALKGLLSEYFEVPVVIQQFVGEWVPIEKASQTVIGRRGKNNQIGRSFCAGKRTWSVQHKFCVVVGPLSFEQYKQMHPDTPKYREVIEVIKLFMGLSFAFQIAFQVERKTVKGMVLGDKGLRLGRSIWMKRSGEGTRLTHTFETEN